MEKKPHDSAGQAESKSLVTPGYEIVPVEPERGPSRGMRTITWLLLFVFTLVATFAFQFRPPARTVVHVAGSPPPIEQPTGELLQAFEQARLAAVRIEARCDSWYGPVRGVGSGFFIDSAGTLLTAYHVVDTSNLAACNPRWTAVTAEQERYRLTLVGFDAYMDLAALRADVERAVPYISLAERPPGPGTPVVAIGNSRDDFLAPRAGRVTRLGVRASRPDFADGTIELTNSLAPGDSGGPVVNARGEAVGVVSFISFNPSAMSTQEFVPPFLRGLTLSPDFAGYAVPLTLSSEVVNAVVSGEARDLPVIGFTWARYDYRPGEGPHDFGPRPGPVVNEVAPGGPADLAGIRSRSQRSEVLSDGSAEMHPEADVIVALDGVATPTYYDLLAQVKSKRIGEIVTLTVQRGNATFRIELELGARTSVFAER